MSDAIILKINNAGELQDNTTIVGILHAALSNLETCQFTLPSRENSLAITKLEEAILWYSKVQGNKEKL